MDIQQLLLTALAHMLFAAGYLGLAVALWLRNSRWMFAAVLALGTAWLLYYRSMLAWVVHLGSDSFSEAQNFDLHEALLFLETLSQVFQRESFLILALTAGASILALWLIHAAGRRLWRDAWRPAGTPVVAAAAAAVAVALLLQAYPAFASFRWNSQYYQRIYDNFHAHDEVRLTSTQAAPLNIVVHIGESTTSMHMGLYGYPRKTTPELEQFALRRDTLLVFHNVFSTHTHTAPSLLEALSVAVDPEEDFLPVSERRRASIIDLLHQAGIATLLISNQGRTGAWNNLASTVVFRNVLEKEYSFDSTWMGELEHHAARPLDHDFLLGALDRRAVLEQPGPRVLFLHSYAGHSPYHRNIAPEFRQPVDDFLEGLPDAAVVGEGISNPPRTVSRLQQYDAVVRYTDHVIAEVLRRVEASPHPAVYVYFSDHGEAAYAGVGHDSSRFLHEMARVPFLVYFNDPAARAYPEPLERLRAAAQARRISTLAQFPATLLALLELTVDHDSLRGIGLDEAADLPPILTRETAAGFGFIPLGDRRPAHANPVEFRETRDPQTSIFLGRSLMRNHATRPCYQQVNSIAHAVRGAFVADCLQVDAEVSPDGQMVLSPASLQDDGRVLGRILDVAGSYGRQLWVRLRYVDSGGRCDAVARHLASQWPAQGTRDVLLTFPAGIALADDALRTCIGELRSLGFRAGLELEESVLGECMAGAADVAEGACAELRARVRGADGSGLFSDLAVPWVAAGLTGRLGLETGLAWNAWGASIDQLGQPPAGIRLLAVDASQDPNFRRTSGR